jgi:hypothetical protein
MGDSHRIVAGLESVATQRSGRLWLASLVGALGLGVDGAQALAQCTAGPCGNGFIGAGPNCATRTYKCSNRYVSHTLTEGAPGTPIVKESLTCDACETDQDQEAGPIAVSVTKGTKVCVSVGAEIEFGDPVGLVDLTLKTATELCVDTQETFSYQHKVQCKARTRVRGDVLEIPTPVTLTIQFEEVLTLTTVPLPGDPCGIGPGNSISLTCRQYAVTATGEKRHILQKFKDEACPPVTATGCLDTHSIYPYQDIEENDGGLYIWVPADVIRCR